MSLDHTKVINDYYSGIPASKIAIKHGASQSSISWCLKKHNIPTRLEIIKQRMITNKAEIIKAYLEFSTCGELGVKYNVCGETISSYLKKWGIKMRHRGYRSVQQKWFFAHKDEVSKEYVNGLSAARLGIQFGVSKRWIKQCLDDTGTEIRPFRKYSLQDDIFDSDIIEQEFPAYLLGLLYADGNIRKMGNIWIVRLGLIVDDVKLLQSINKRIGSTYPINYTQEKTSVWPNGKKYTSRAQARLQYNSLHLGEGLIKHGCFPQKTERLYFPNTIATNSIHHFIRGYFDGDGSLSVRDRDKNADFRITSGSLEVLSGIKREIEYHVGVEVPLVKDRREGVNAYWVRIKYSQRPYFQGKENVFRVMRWLYSDATIFMERKYEKYRELAAFLKSRDFNQMVFWENHISKPKRG